MRTAGRMHRTTLGWLAITLLALSSARVATADEETLPDAMTILDRAEAACGDAAKISAIRTIVYQGESEMMGMKGSVTESYARPMKALSVTEYPGLGKMLSGTDGKTVWEDNGPQGVVIHEGHSAELMRHGYAARLSIPWRDVYSGFELEGIAKVKGRDCYKMRLTAEGVLPEYCYFDCDTYRPARVELTLLEPSGQKLPIQITYSDWKQVNDVWYAHRHEIGLNRMTIVLRYSKIEHNVKLKDDLFELPANVKQAAAERR